MTKIVTYKFATLSSAEIEAMLDITLQETRVYQEAKAVEALYLVLRQLTRKLKQELPEAIKAQVGELPLAQLESLGEALLDFDQLADLQAWLEQSSG